MRTKQILVFGCLAAGISALVQAQEQLPPASPTPVPADPAGATSLADPGLPPIAPLGQPPAMQVPQQPPTGYPLVGTSYPVLPPLAAQAPYYWRVGTRNCEQTFGGGLCECRLTVSGCGPDGRWRPSSEAEMMGSLQQGGPICVMAHGSLVDERGSRVDSRGTYRWLRNAAPQMPVHVIFFDWPSERCIGPMAAVQFLKLGRQAARNGLVLAKLVSRLPADSPVCLIGHSHGARLVCAATHLMGGGKVQGESLAHPDRHHRLRLVLAAAAIDHHWLNPGERYCQTVVRAENIVSIENRADFALHLYPLQRPLGVTALGQKGLWQSDERALGPYRQRIYHLDVTSLIGKGHLWPHYYSKPRIAQTIVPSVFYPDIYGSVHTGAYPPAVLP